MLLLGFLSILDLIDLADICPVNPSVGQTLLLGPKAAYGVLTEMAVACKVLEL